MGEKALNDAKYQFLKLPPGWILALTLFKDIFEMDLIFCDIAQKVVVLRVLMPDTLAQSNS